MMVALTVVVKEKTISECVCVGRFEFVLVIVNGDVVDTDIITGDDVWVKRTVCEGAETVNVNEGKLGVKSADVVTDGWRCETVNE